MNVSPGRSLWRSLLYPLAAVVVSSLLFAASFPNLLFENGVPLFAWIAYIPVFWLLSRVSLPASVFWGALYGYAAYGLFNYWLTVFHPVAGLVVGLVYLVYFAFFFPVLKLAEILFPKKGYILQWLLWLAYEYLRTLGFLGYPYGITGYSQWTVLPVIQIAAVFGVWGVSALVIFPSAYLAAALREASPLNLGRHLKEFFLKNRLPGVLWLAALVLSLVYGFAFRVDYRDAKMAKLALIQHNSDPWKGGIKDFEKNYRVLKRLSLEALAQEPRPDLMVWSETAFVPRIYWHITYRGDPESYNLVKELIEFLQSQDVPYLIGNDDGRLELSSAGAWERVDYNGAMLFEKGEMREVYRKLHLVPFTEHFPYEKQLPGLYKLLTSRDDIHLWKAGSEATVFDAGGLKFSTPICFEDTFGYLSRDFVRNGAELIVNISNDAWSGSLPAQNQHLSMAVFRAIENRRSMVRSTASGQTCAVDPNGKILALAEPFTESYLLAEVPVVSAAAPYTFYGDLWAWIFTAAALVLLIAGIGRRILHIQEKAKGRGSKNQPEGRNV